MKMQKSNLRTEPSLSIKNANHITMPHSCLKSTSDRRRHLNNITSTKHHWNNFKFIAYTLAIIHMLKRHTRRSDPTWCLLPCASFIRERRMFRCEMFIRYTVHIIVIIVVIASYPICACQFISCLCQRQQWLQTAPYVELLSAFAQNVSSNLFMFFEVHQSSINSITRAKLLFAICVFIVLGLLTFRITLRTLVECVPMCCRRWICKEVALPL